MANKLSYDSTDFNYRTFLSKLVDGLTEKNLKNLKFLLIDLLDAGIIEKIDDGHCYLKTLEQNQIIFKNDLSYLCRSLETIGRKDLVKKVVLFEEDNKMGRSNNLYERNEGLGNTNKRTTNSSKFPTYKLTPTDIKNNHQRITAVNISNNFPVETNDVNEILQLKKTLPIFESNYIDSYSIGVPSGICHIINNQFLNDINSEDDRLLMSRNGTVKDVIELKNTFSWLNFKVFIHHDIEANNILKIITSPQEIPIDCFVCCILSHGFYDGVYGSDGKKVTFDKMQAAINGNSARWLLGKPKLFFIQACQGDEEEKEALCKDSSVSNSRPKETLDNLTNLAEDADFCFSVATTPGKVAYRHPTDGSWYIQTLCQILREYAASLSFTDMLLKLNYMIAEKKDQTLKNVLAKQMSSMRYNTLRMALHFKPNGLYIEEAFRNVSLN